MRAREARKLRTEPLGDSAIRKALKGVAGRQVATPTERTERWERRRKWRGNVKAERAAEGAVGAEAALHRLYDPKRIAKRRARRESVR